MGETQGQEEVLMHCWQRFTAGIGGSTEAVPGLHSEALEGFRVRHYQAGPLLLLCLVFLLVCYCEGVVPYTGCLGS